MRIGQMMMMASKAPTGMVLSTTGTNVTPDLANKRIIFNFNNGFVQTFSTDKAGILVLRAWGGAGGSAGTVGGGGGGGYAKSVVNIQPGITYNVMVGDGGSKSSGTGAWNGWGGGGGLGYGGHGGDSYGGQPPGGGGGAASSIYTGSQTRASLLVMAGGGGGGASGASNSGVYYGGAGGGGTGQTAAAGAYGAQGTGGTQTGSGGSGGAYGNGGFSQDRMHGSPGGPAGGGGGGGYYGGGGGGFYNGGGGGSGFHINGLTTTGNYATPANPNTYAGWYTGIATPAINANGGPGLVVIAWDEVNPNFATPSGTITQGSLGLAYSQSVIAYDLDGSAITYSIVSGSLPAGLSINAASGLISGTPTGSNGTSTFTVRASSVSGSIDRVFSILVDNTAPIWNTGAAVSVITDTATNYQLSTTDPNGDLVSYAVLSGTLPTGLSMSSSGLITGTPTISGNSVVTFRATDALGAYTDKTISLLVVV